VFSGHESQSAARRESDMGSPECRHARDAFERGNGLAGHFETRQVEWRDEQSPAVHVGQVTAFEIAPEISIALHDLPGSVRQRLHDDVRVFEVAGLAVRREHHRSAPKHCLRPSLSDLSGGRVEPG
jgi:hypothetical protein